MRTAVAGFLSVLLVATAIGGVIAWQEHRAFYGDPEIRAVLDSSPGARAYLAQADREATIGAARRLITHVLFFGCLVLTGIVVWQRAICRDQRAKAERWKALYENASSIRRSLQTELQKQGPHVVRHSRDKTFSAICARCGCLVTERFKTRAEALGDRARTETGGCLACPSEAGPSGEVAGSTED